MTELVVYVKGDMVSLSADIVSRSIAHKIALKRSEKEVFTAKNNICWSFLVYRCLTA